MQVKVPVAVGELIDKITILRIKTRMIRDEGKRANVRRELDALLQVCEASRIDLGHAIVQELEEVNEELWRIEDDIREKERDRCFDEKFVELARSVYRSNDRRFALKSKINALFGSEFQEEKSYEDY